MNSLFDGCGKILLGFVAIVAAVWIIFFTSFDGGSLAFMAVCGADHLMEGILVFGSLGFWAFITALILATMALAENSRIILAALVLAAGGFALQKYSGVAILPYIFANPWILVFIALGYFLVGTVWAVAKWRLFLNKTRRIYDEIRQELLNHNDFKNKPEDPGEDPYKNVKDRTVELCNAHNVWVEKYNLYEGYTRNLTNALHDKLVDALGYDYKIQIKPKVSNFKAKIVGWILYWPTSIIWTSAADSVYHLKMFAVDCYKRIANYLQTMADNAWKDTEIK